jgi:hypothetical protein
MKNPSRNSFAIAIFLFGVALAWAPAAAQNSKVAEGLIVNLGLLSAEEALRADGHRDAHPTNPPSGSQHLLITLDDQKSRARIGNAEVDVEVTDPKGRLERKRLLHTQAAGLPDYSDLFVFGWTGEYSIRVIITVPGAKSIETRFTVHHKV